MHHSYGEATNASSLPPAVAVTATSLSNEDLMDYPQDQVPPTEGELLSLAEQIWNRKTLDDVQFNYDLGAVVANACTAYGNGFVARLADRIGCKPNTLFEYATVYRQYPTGIAELASRKTARGRSLPWSFFTQLARVPEPLRDELHALVLAKDWTIADLRREVSNRRSAGTGVPKKVEPAQLLVRARALKDALATVDPDALVDECSLDELKVLRQGLDEYLARHAFGHQPIPHPIPRISGMSSVPENGVLHSVESEAPEDLCSTTAPTVSDVDLGEPKGTASALVVAPVLQVARQLWETTSPRAHRVKLARSSGIVLPSPNPDGRYRTLLIDPPWNEKGGGGRGAQNHYPLMSTNEIVQTIAGCPLFVDTAPDCFLFLWNTSNFLSDAIRVGHELGFRHVTDFIWLKPHIGLGQYRRSQHEQLLVFKRGSPKRIGQWRSSVLIEEEREHSRKPEVGYEMIEAVAPGPYAELFARGTREGWVTWGDQAGPGANTEGLLTRKTAGT